MWSTGVVAYFLASSLEISSSVRPLVSGMQRMTNTSRAKLMAAWRNMMFGRPIFSGESRAVENALFLTLLCFAVSHSRCKSQVTMQTNANPAALRALNQGTQLPAGSKKIYSTRVCLFSPELVEPVRWEKSLGFTGTCTACSLFLPCHLRLSNDNILLGLLGELSRESLFSLLRFCLNVCFKKKPTYYWKSALHDVTEGTGTSPRLAKTEPANRVTAKYAVFWHTIRSNP